MTQTALQPTDKNIYESLALRGDLSLLKPEEKAVYLQRLCESLQLNPLTQPFIPLKLNGKEILYASRGATDQLASNHKLTREIIDTKRIDDVYIVTCKVTAPDGRFETGTGAVSLGNLKGDALANALMKAETKAKRRATLSFCGLGFMDESELETIPANRIERDRRPAAEPKQITAASVEIIDAEPLLPDHPTEAAESLYLQLDELYKLENNPNREKALANFSKLQTLTEKENVLAEVRARVETALREKVKSAVASDGWPYMPDKTVEYLASFGIDAIDKAEIPALKKALESFAEDGIL